jgi:hypothetical protein
MAGPAEGRPGARREVFVPGCPETCWAALDRRRCGLAHLGRPPSRHSIRRIRGRRASWACLELVGSRRPASLDPDRSATKSRQSASVGSAWPRASRNPANALNSASWRLIVVLDLPAAVNATITRADASRRFAASIGIGLLLVVNRQGDSSPRSRRQRRSPARETAADPLLDRRRGPDRTSGPVGALTRTPPGYVARTSPRGTPASGNTPTGHITQPST